MSYSKKDEDADQAIVKVDRTAVFQEGGNNRPFNSHVRLTVYHQPDFSIVHLYRLGNVAYSSPRSLF